MRTIRTKVYKFNELKESAKENVIERHYDINVNFDWWESTYEDAANIGLEIKGFDIDRASYVKAEFDNNAIDTAKRIIAEHGENCETYKTAQNFLTECEKIRKQAEIEGKDGDEDYWFDNEIEEVEDEFLKSLCEDYRIILTTEYEYQTSKEAIIETIEANEYEFTADGRMI
jgi:hypothetical protein